MTVRGQESVAPEAVKVELERIVTSAAFADSPRIAAFLRYVVEARLAGEDDRIQEYGIGLAVFERPESFDPRIDSIVRVEARRLREKLARHYETAEASGPVRIELPRRGYKPRFVEAAEVPEPSTPAFELPSWTPWAIAAVAVAALAGRWLWPEGSPPQSHGERIVFSVEPPPGMDHVPGYKGGGTVVSPDGRRIAFVAGVPGGDQALYVRELDDPAPRRVEGSEGARWPFWSPDSRRVGFGASGFVKTADLDAGLVVSLCLESFYFGGAWGGKDGDTIVFGERFQGLYRVAASGGEAEPLTQLREGEVGHGWPEFLPDGRRFLFVARSNELAPSSIPLADRGVRVDFSIELGRLNDGSRRKVAEADSQAVITVRSGEPRLLFVRDDTLFERAVDPETMNLSGPLLAVTGDISRSSVGFGKHDFSAAREGVLTFRRGFYFGRSEIAWYDRAGRRLEQAAPPDQYHFMSLSPDGRMIAAAIASEDENVDVWTIDLERGVRQRRTRHPALDRVPTWSPDSSTILFNSLRTGPKTSPKEAISYMYTVPRGGGEVTHFPMRAPGVREGGWPSDWKRGRVVYSLDQHLYWGRPGAQGEPLLQEEFYTINGRLSPDGRLIAFLSNESGDDEIWLAPVRQMDNRVQVSNAGGNYPLWRGDGRELFYLAPDGVLMAVNVDPSTNRLVSRPRELFQMNLPFSAAPTIYRYAVAADGQRFLCQNLLDRPAPVVVVDR